MKSQRTLNTTFQTIEEVEAHNAKVRAKRGGQQSHTETGQAAIGCAWVDPPKVGKVIRQSSRQPNKTELRFEQEYLKIWKVQGEIEGYDYEPITLKIANGCRYTPDWFVDVYRDTSGYSNRLRFYEIKAKGNIHDDAIVKLKCAAASFPQFEFHLATYRGKMGWTIERVLP